MQQSTSAYFPFTIDNINSCLKRATTVEDTLLSAIRFFLLTRKGSRVGNSNGSIVPDLLYQLVPQEQLPNIATEIKTELSDQFPGVDFVGVTLIPQFLDNTYTLVLTITFTTPNQLNISELIIQLPSLYDSLNTI